MKFATIERTEGGYFLDPRPYLAHLVQFRGQLPDGAVAFAEDPCHYDFSSTKCVKDLKFSSITLRDAAHGVSAEIQFAPNKFKHDSGLLVRYEDVALISVDVAAKARDEHVWPDSRRLGDLQLDEILPHERGCSHEIAMTGGSLRIIAADLNAEWFDNDEGASLVREPDDRGL